MDTLKGLSWPPGCKGESPQRLRTPIFCQIVKDLYCDPGRSGFVKVNGLSVVERRFDPLCQTFDSYDPGRFRPGHNPGKCPKLSRQKIGCSSPYKGEMGVLKGPLNTTLLLLK